MDDRPALVLLSGGLDSITALAWARAQGYIIRIALSFDYGQRHVREAEAAAAVAADYGVPHQVIALPPIAGSSLTGRGAIINDGPTIPQGHDMTALSEQIAPTYVPNRNMILIAYAAAHALLSDAAHLIGGWNAADALNYPDCRDDFLETMQQALRLATLREFRIVRPLIDDDKPAIVRRALALRAPLHKTWTCYLGGQVACGNCDACQLRVAAFQQVGVIDPLAYAIDIDWSNCKPYTQAYETGNSHKDISL